MDLVLNFFSRLEELLPYKLCHLDEGFRYLRYPLKPNKYNEEDHIDFIRKPTKGFAIGVLDGCLWQVECS